jgi:CheY-like chemotaxis protein
MNLRSVICLLTINTLNPDLVFLDVRMPGADFEVEEGGIREKDDIRI